MYSFAFHATYTRSFNSKFNIQLKLPSFHFICPTYTLLLLLLSLFILTANGVLPGGSGIQ
jgi:hypothetical protein